jgi:hypothetical protein
MSFSRTVKLKLKGPMRALVKFLKYYAYQTHYIEGDGGELIVGKRVYLVNTLFNVESGSIFIGGNAIFGYNVMVLTGRHHSIKEREYQFSYKKSILIKDLVQVSKFHEVVMTFTSALVVG